MVAPLVIYAIVAPIYMALVGTGLIASKNIQEKHELEETRKRHELEKFLEDIITKDPSFACEHKELLKGNQYIADKFLTETFLSQCIKVVNKVGVNTINNFINTNSTNPQLSNIVKNNNLLINNDYDNNQQTDNNILFIYLILVLPMFAVGAIIALYTLYNNKKHKQNNISSTLDDIELNSLHDNKKISDYNI